jgi:4,5:9,10-diseco-3-hydroxy-5,9,17-trioxoandrosta-1(10),2-diene-4-oate hydrolase
MILTPFGALPVLAGIGGLVATALCIAMLYWASKRIDQWETVELDDATQGKFMTLSDGERLHYVASVDPALRSAEDRESVILIHGLMDSTYSWAKNFDALAQAHRVWAIDLIGFGFSSRMTERKYSLKYSARIVREFMDAQGIERATLVGHSLGGAVALEVAHDFPDRVNRLILVAPATYRLNLPAVANWVARMPVVPRALASLSATSPRLRIASWRHALGDPAYMDEAQTSALLQTARVKGSTDALVAMAASPRSSDLPEALGKITLPTLIIWGAKDSTVPASHGSRHVHALPNAELVVLEGAGHIPHVERPPEVNRLMLNFMRENHVREPRVES